MRLVNGYSQIERDFNISEEFVIGHIGNFATVKNQSFLVDIFKKVHEKNSKTKLIMVGGCDRSLIENKVSSLHLENDVIFTGARSDVADLLQAFDVFVFPSLYEGLGIVAIEAQASGLHTICSDVIPKETQITDLIEYVSLEESPEKWADTVLKYNNHYDREDTSKQIRAAGYDIHTTAKKVQSFYLKLAERSK